MNPTNLDECIAELEKSLPKELIEKLKNKEIDPVSLHHSVGRSMRNRWSLWGESELKEWFKEIGIFHPDDMSGIILDSLALHLRGKPINLKKQVKYYKDYWEVMKKAPKNGTFHMEKKNGKWAMVV